MGSIWAVKNLCGATGMSRTRAGRFNLNMGFVGLSACAVSCCKATLKLCRSKIGVRELQAR
jgi:hypothetical protein